jgi:hypothetical protein
VRAAIRHGLAFLGRHALAVLALGVALGLVWQGGAAILRRGLSELVFLIMVASFLGIDWRLLFERLRRPVLLLSAVAWVLLGAPLLVAAALRAVRPGHGLMRPMILWAAAAPLVSSVPLALMLGFDSALALLVMIFGTLALPLTLPLFALSVLGLSVAVGAAALALRLAALAIGSLVAAVLVKPLLRRSGIAPGAVEANGINALVIFAFNVGVMGGARGLIAAAPLTALLYIGAAFVESGALFAVTALLFAPFGKRTALTVALSAGFSNFALVWAALGGAAAGGNFLLFFFAIQFPINLLPLAMRLALRRLARPGEEGRMRRAD